MALPRIEVGLARDERLPAILLLMFFVVLCLAGGASREDVLAQSVIRASAVGLVLIQILFGRLPAIDRYRGCAWLIGGMMAVAALQLVPLPPTLWAALPGRSIITNSPLGSSGWRPLNLVPDAGWNALWSLLAPLCALTLLSSLDHRNVRRAQYFLLAAVTFSAFVALLQAAGIAPDNPLINGSTTDYAGIFANRNHQALFLAIGISIAWFWGFERADSWRDRRLWLAACLALLFLVSILVTGSRTGALLGAIAIIVGPTLAKNPRPKGERRISDWALWPTVSLLIFGGVLGLNAYFGRALSLERATVLTLGDEFRVRSLSTVLDVAKTYFPFGAGLGTFDTVFRIAEPASLLEPTYFNHAHDDFLETVIETGIAGPAILIGAVIWLIRRILAASTQDRKSARMVRLGAMIVGIVAIASVSDYPARTPMIMVALVLAGCWLTGRSPDRSDVTTDALPPTGKSL